MEHKDFSTGEEFMEHLEELDKEVEEESKAKTKKQSVPIPAPPKAKADTPPKTTYAVVSGKDRDTVHLSKAVYNNTVHKRSLTVHHIQRRLVEWGHYDAFLDRDGFYGEKTKKSVVEFQDRVGIQATGLMDAETMTRLFDGDTNVIVELS